jgi:hypothetical protein
MIEVSQEVWNKLLEENILISTVEFPTIPSDSVKCILDLMSVILNEYNCLDYWTIVLFETKAGVANIDGVTATITEMTQPETNLETIDAIINAFARGYRDNGWTWRSTTSLATEIQMEEDIITQILNENDELFEQSSNGMKWRYTQLE